MSRLPNPHRNLGKAIALACFGCTLLGCGQASSGPPEVSKLTTLAVAYGLYQSRHGEPPPDEATFKAFLTEHSQQLLEKSGVEQLDALFVSSRDGQPFVIKYGDQDDPMGRKPIAFEQVGQGGRRYVGFTLGMISEVDEEAFQALMAGEPQGDTP